MAIKEIEEIKHALLEIADEYSVKRAKLFGSYANNEADHNSDIDLLVELDNKATLLTLTGLKYKLEDLLGINVDIIEMPVPEDSILQIEKAIDLYEQ